MSKFISGLNLIDCYKTRYRELIAKDLEGKGFFFNPQRKSWIFYRYEECATLLNSSYVTRQGMHIPLELFNSSDRQCVQTFLELINKSIIFSDTVRGDVVKLIYKNYKSFNVDDVASLIFNALTRNKAFSEKELGAVNDRLANQLVGIHKNSFFLNRHAKNLGMLFDGRVDGKDHFVSIASSFLLLVSEFKKKFDSWMMPETSVVDIVISYMAAHQTTMQLIVATLYDIWYFGIAVEHIGFSSVVTESARLHSPILSAGRVFDQNVTYKGTQFKKGDKVLFYTGMSGFDASVFDNPFSFNANRNHKILSFGSGGHACIGMGIAVDFASVLLRKIFNAYKIKNITIHSLLEGVSALGSNKFDVEFV